MNLPEAWEKARQILDEEQVRPTIGYSYVSDEWPSWLLLQETQLRAQNYTAAIAALLDLVTQRNQRPRKVHENPKLYAFRSTNFELLLKIFSQVADADRAGFVTGILDSVRKPTAHRYTSQPVPFPSFSEFTSALALLAEFCVRTGYLKELLSATAVPELPAYGSAVMLKQIEEMIALNFNLLSDNDLELIPQRLAHLREIAYKQTWAQRRRFPGGPFERNPDYHGEVLSKLGNEIVAAIDGITEECRQARYWYLKGALQELPNLEIAGDKLKVEDYLVRLGFSSEMVASLNAAESDFKSTANAFELKNCLGHLRSFLEHLHRESARRIASKAGDMIADAWGAATSYLRKEGYFTQQHEAFVISLYTLLSDESVHPLTADREYARLLRNVVIEYGVMFLVALDKRGVKLNEGKQEATA